MVHAHVIEVHAHVIESARLILIEVGEDAPQLEVRSATDGWSVALIAEGVVDTALDLVRVLRNLRLLPNNPLKGVAVLREFYGLGLREARALYMLADEKATAPAKVNGCQRCETPAAP